MTGFLPVLHYWAWWSELSLCQASFKLGACDLACSSDLDFPAGRDLSLVGDRIGRVMKASPSRNAESAQVGRAGEPSHLFSLQGWI